MSKPSRRTLGLAFAALAALSIGAGAQGRGKGHDKGRGSDALIDQRIPPGLAKKPGGMPPGQYKKRYGASDGVGVMRDVFTRRGYTVVRTAPYGTSQYVYYRSPDGSTHRAIVSPGTTRLAFRNVPPSLLQEIRALLP